MQISGGFLEPCGGFEGVTVKCVCVGGVVFAQQILDISSFWLCVTLCILPFVVSSGQDGVGCPLPECPFLPAALEPQDSFGGSR